MQVGDPRDDAEAAIAEKLSQGWEQVGSLIVDSGRRARRGVGGRSTIYHIVVPHNLCSRCSITRAWTAESGHAWLDTSFVDTEAGAGRACAATAL